MQIDEFKTEAISLIEVDNKPIGTIGINESDGAIVIGRLYIIDSYQSKGIGSKIINDIIDKYPGKTLRLGVLKVNNRAKRLYESLGFKVYGEENEHYKMEYKVNKCLNCGTIAGEKFCPNCGQKTSFRRYTIRQILHDFFHSFTHVDSGILFLIKELSIRPGTVAREYVSGKKKKYFSPSQYLIIGIAVITFLTINLNLGYGILGGKLTFTSENVENMIAQFTIFFYKYYNILQFITVPFTAFYSWLFFRKARFNYAENLVLNTFLIGHRHLIFLFFIPFLYFFPEKGTTIISIHFALWTIYFVYAYLQFYKSKHKIWAALKTIIIVWLFTLTQSAIMALVFLFFIYKKPV
jgi:N-acetylglutamate synthase-like GNAT family acetyltransferase